jgi:circadian clock protein KaiC
VKMLRYQQQFNFFDQSKLGESVRFINLSQLVLEQDLNAVLAEVVKHVEAFDARIVVVESFRTVVRRAQASAAEMELQGFVQRLALHLTSWQVASFLVGEYVEAELRDNPVFTVADGLLWLFQSTERNSIVRKMQIMKLRGQGSVPGLHTFRITQDGLQTFPRTFGLAQESGPIKGTYRVSTGIPELDKLMGGGIPDGSSLLPPVRRDRASQFWRRNSLPKDCARANRAWCRFLKSFPPNSPAGPLSSASTSIRPRETASSRSSTSVRSTFRSMRPSMPSLMR